MVRRPLNTTQWLHWIHSMVTLGGYNVTIIQAMGDTVTTMRGEKTMERLYNFLYIWGRYRVVLGRVII